MPSMWHRARNLSYRGDIAVMTEYVECNVGQEKVAGQAQSEKKCEDCKHSDTELEKPPCKDCWNSENRDDFRPKKVDNETDNTDRKSMFEEGCPLCGC